MTLITINPTDPLLAGRQSERALAIRRGIQRMFFEQRWATLPELSLANGRRADLIALGPKSEIVIIEIKSSVEDFKSDNKWSDYKPFCDQFYFATLSDVPAHIFPESEGFIVADKYGAEILRTSQIDKIAAGTRKSIVQRFAASAADRLLAAEFSATNDKL